MHPYSQQHPCGSHASNVTNGTPQPQPQRTDAILHVQDLTKVYSDTRNKVATRALNGMSLDVYQAEFIGIMGPSGSGKTTLLNILAGLDRPTSGGLWLQGQDMAALKASELALFRRR
ncbi:MAG: ATP-binding cassette domain-containing protein, partial [Ktedonobacterales bacterium]